MTPLLAALAAMSLLGGLLLIGSGIRPRLTLPAPTSTTLVNNRVRGLFSRSGRGSRRSRLLLVGGVVVGALVWLLTGWIVAIVVVPAFALLLPTLLVTTDNVDKVLGALGVN